MAIFSNIGASAIAGITLLSGFTLSTVRLYALYTDFQDTQKIKLDALISKNHN